MRRLSRETAQAVAIASCWGVGLAVAVMALYDVVPWRNVFESTAAAAWVQALGAICAIAVGFWIAWWQIQHGQRREAERENGRLEIVATLIFEARAVADEAFTDSRSSVKFERSCEHLAYYVQAMQTIQPFDVPEWRVTHALAAAVSRFDRNKAFVHAAMPEVGADRTSAQEKWMNVIREDLSYAEGIVRDVLRERGRDVPDVTITDQFGRIISRSQSASSSTK